MTDSGSRKSEADSDQGYLDFDLDIDAVPGDDDSYVVESRSDAGEVKGQVQLPQDLVETGLRIAHAVLPATARNVVADEASGVDESHDTKEFGRRLFDTLLQGAVLTKYRECLLLADTSDKKLRIRLRLPTPEIAMVPWELLYDPDPEAHVCLLGTSLVRHLEVPTRIKQIPVHPPLRVLGVVASPRGLPGLDVQRERDLIDQALATVRSSSGLEVKWLADARWPDVRDNLTDPESAWHVVHFIGHGCIDEGSRISQLALLDNNGNAEFLDADRVAYLLADHRSLRFVFLNACMGAGTTHHGVFSSIGATLARRGVPSVLAMQYPITDRSAIQLAEGLYSAIAHYRPLDEAVTEARIRMELSTGRSAEWATPVLFLRARDSVLLRPAPEPAVGESWEGTITFLVADLEHASEYWQLDATAMASAMTSYRSMLERAAEEHEGRAYKTVGDRCFGAFRKPGEALSAALRFQAEMADHDWARHGVGFPQLRARVGLHTCVAEEHLDDFVGPQVPGCKHLAAAAHGGQIVLSRDCALLARHELGADVELAVLGEYEIRHVSGTLEIWQAREPGIDTPYPDLRARRRTQSNLPRSLRSFVGRTQDVDEIVRDLSSQQLITLVGPPGVGKSRLAVNCAERVSHDFPAGTWLVDLSHCEDPDAAPQVVATALGIADTPNQSVYEALADWFSVEAALLVLDNCEYVPEACASICDRLISSCESVRIIATSHQALRARSEHVRYVRPLALPPPMAPRDPAELAGYDSVELLVERVNELDSSFALTSANAPAMAKITRLLDGVPLALELAADAVADYGPTRVARDLQVSFDGLGSSTPELLSGQQKLQSAVEWGLRNLDSAERALFNRLSVFAGGFDLDAAVEVCADADDDVRRILSRLLRKSFVLAEDTESGQDRRYRILRTMRAHGMAQLVSSGEEIRIRDLHLMYFVAFAERAEAHLQGPDQSQWSRRVAQDHGNALAALAWAARRKKVDRGLRLAIALAAFWTTRGHIADGRQQLEAMLDLADDGGHLQIRARALSIAGAFARRQGDYEAAMTLLEQTRDLQSQELSPSDVADTIREQGTVADEMGDYEGAQRHYEESLALSIEAEYAFGVAAAKNNLGNVMLHLGRPDKAERLYRDGLERFQALRNQWATGTALRNLGNAAMDQEQFDAAKALYEESRRIAVQIEDQIGLGESLHKMGRVLFRLGDLDHSRLRLGQAWLELKAVGQRLPMAELMEALATVDMEAKCPERAISLLAAADRVRREIGAPIRPKDAEHTEDSLERLRSDVGEPAFEAQWAAASYRPADELVLEATRTCETQP